MNDIDIVYEDNHIIVVLKPQGVPTCGDESGDDSLLEGVRRYLKVTYEKPGNVYVGLIHRLDRPTGGVMVFAKTSKAASRLSEQMRGGDFEKKYFTVLVGTPKEPQKTLVNYLKKNPVNNMVYLCPPTTDGAKMASLDYRVLQEREGLCLAEVRLHTGRTHQIRVQMAGIGHPVYGDMRYGGENAKKGWLALWAYSLSFTHPVTKERMRFMVQPPADNVPWKYFDLDKPFEL
ncbi:MAG TPA: RluA family pseudouridine synthase [Candidatus Borkfalkia faecavium]|uniref:RNA pseudouridylate synthase n=1 Tax=Candidatus Borkfalkia faecavium TaxID=2838508 RepID=A0A9D2ATY2_9FIRM|nr:RluA family pseudouridine synthase [Candidatus Borkfalkia faecavium]